MLITPSHYYQRVETVIESATELSEFFKRIGRIAERNKYSIYWRGQADCTWGLTSSLARLAPSSAELTDKTILEAEDVLVSAATEWLPTPKAGPLNKLETLALLQHHSIPTRLLDFSSDPLVATFFAAEHYDDIEGRIFALLVPKDTALKETEVGQFDFADVKTGEIRLWTPRAEISPRLDAQGGVFALGNLPSTDVTRTTHDPALNQGKGGNRMMVRSEVVQTMSLPFRFLKEGSKWRGTGPIPRSYTARIHVDKASLREQLAKRSTKSKLRPKGAPIDHKFVYPDVDGLLRYSPEVRRIQRGIP